MKYLDEYRDQGLAEKLSAEIIRITTREHVIMEICGGQTHSIVKFGLDKLLPDKIELVHGPGCPVCVTPIELIDKAVKISSKRNVIFCSFGDMLRVPGSEKDLFSVKAEGGDIRVVYSPLDALKIAQENANKEVVFFAIGFETTAPANAMAVYQAREQKIPNFSMLVSHVLVPPAMEAILSSENNRVNGFLAAGHVCAVMGYREYEPIAGKYRVPVVVTGFEPADILQGILMCVRQMEEGRYEVQNQYVRCVNRDGNIPAQDIMARVFQVCSRKWRGIGEIKNSGLMLRDEYREFDSERRFGIAGMSIKENSECISGLILQGVKKPNECPMFSIKCTPEKPLGATMVSSEGACAAYYHYRKITQWKN